MQHSSPQSDKILPKECISQDKILQDIDVFCSVSAAEEIADHREEYLAVLVSDQLASSSEILVYVWHYKTQKLVFHEEKPSKEVLF